MCLQVARGTIEEEEEEEEVEAVPSEEGSGTTKCRKDGEVEKEEEEEEMCGMASVINLTHHKVSPPSLSLPPSLPPSLTLSLLSFTYSSIIQSTHKSYSSSVQFTYT